MTAPSEVPIRFSGSPQCRKTRKIRKNPSLSSKQGDREEMQAQFQPQSHRGWRVGRGGAAPTHPNPTSCPRCHPLLLPLPAFPGITEWVGLGTTPKLIQNHLPPSQFAPSTIPRPFLDIRGDTTVPADPSALSPTPS